MANPLEPISFDRDYINNGLIPQLNTLIFATECSNNPINLTSFTFAGGDSSYSFGRYQYDLGHNPQARAFLAQIGFTQDQITMLRSNGGLSEASDQELCKMSLFKYSS